MRLQNNSFEAGYTANFVSIIITFYGFWNLDFFRYVLPPFCVSPKLQRIHIVTLYYISAFYPLCLIGVTWFLIKLHSRDIKPITWLWGKLKHFSKSVNMKFEGSHSLIDVFATFFLLSYAKLLFTSFNILAYGITYNFNNSTLVSTVSCRDRSKHCFLQQGTSSLCISITHNIFGRNNSSYITHSTLPNQSCKIIALQMSTK